MNTLIVVPWDQERGGVASVVGYVGRYLTSHGHRVLFMNPGLHTRAESKRTKWGFDGVEMRMRDVLLPGARIKSTIGFFVTLPAAIAELRRLIKQYEITVINVHYPNSSSGIFAVARALFPVKLVVSIHGTDLVPSIKGAVPPNPAVAMLLRAADVIVSPSHGYLAECASVLPPGSRQVAIPNGIDVDEMQRLASEASDKVPRDAGYVLTVASHDEWKGIDVLLRALAVMRDRGAPVRAVLAGDGPLRGQLESLGAELRLDGLVRFAGNVDRPTLAALLAGCDMVAMPSRLEPFGIAVIEAMAARRAVVATRVGGLPEIVQDGVTGLLVPKDDVGALANALERLAGDPALRNSLAAAGYDRVRTRFSWQGMGEAYLNLFTELLGDAQ